MSPRRIPPHRLARLAVAAVALALVTLAVFDLWGPRHTDIRRFDPLEVARLDTEMWRAYYDKKPGLLFLQLAELLRGQFHFPWLRSYLAAAYSAHAAFVFKDGRERRDYERALPDLVAYFGSIRRLSATPFDVHRTAELELEWWIVHRERERHPPNDLERALADAAAALYGVPAASLAGYAHERGVAMVMRDTCERSGGVSERDWNEIARHLRAAWKALARTVQPTTPPEPVAAVDTVMLLLRRGPAGCHTRVASRPLA